MTRKITYKEKKEIEARYARPRLVNNQEEWFCYHCKSSFGVQPRGITIVCKQCGRENILPGLDIIPRKRTKEIIKIEQQSKKYASEKYQLMRER